MEKYKNSFVDLCKNKLYQMLLSVTAVLSYGFMITHHTVGIDDTSYAYYFQEGLSAIIGRWMLFLLNKIFLIGEFTPLVTDLAGVLILMAAVTVWAALFRCILREKIPEWGYSFFAAIFLSCPLISEVYTYYLHNGISIGYLFIGISLCFLKRWWENPKDLRLSVGVVCFLWSALGCYESFMIVWLLGALLLLLTECHAGRKCRISFPLVMTLFASLVAVALRSLMIAAVTGIFDLGHMKGEAVQRSVTEMISWIFKPGAGAEFAMILKRIYVMYGVFAFHYLPIKIFLLALFIMFVYGIFGSIREKNAWILILTVGCFFVSFLLALVEGKSTLYRSAQFLPVVCGYGVLLLCLCMQRLRQGCLNRGHDKTGKFCAGVVIFGLVVVLWNQCADMNRWFYVDYTKYEAAKETMSLIAYELEKNYDVGDKPVMFTGIYEIPRELVQAAYVPYNTKTFYCMKRWTDFIDGHLLEKFYRDYGVWVAQTPSLPVIEWGRYAFGDDSELIRFLDMHGHTLIPYTESDKYGVMEIYSLNLPKFPQEGSIVDMGGYIIVHF